MNARILEVTLRDGSYLIDFQFSAADTRTLCAGLEGCGFTLIEVGHGVGLGASREGYGQAAATDEEYAQAAAESLDIAEWGMFCIPGIARLSDLDVLAEYGATFVRIGTNIDEVSGGEPFIARAKDLGLYVTANFMKSYAVDPTTFGHACQNAELYGADLVYIVDSAGGMLLPELSRYIDALQTWCGLPWGFHGHNNLDLAVSNSLAALEEGAAWIDTSLQGMGRSAGNTPTGVFLLAAARAGHRFPERQLATFDLGESHIKPLLAEPGYSSLEAVTGYAQFHSSYMPTIRKYALKYGVDPRRLIIDVCKQELIRCPDTLVEKVAKGLALQGEVYTAGYRMDRYHGEEETMKGSTAA